MFQGMYWPFSASASAPSVGRSLGSAASRPFMSSDKKQATGPRSPALAAAAIRVTAVREAAESGSENFSHLGVVDPFETAPGLDTKRSDGASPFGLSVGGAFFF